MHFYSVVDLADTGNGKDGCLSNLLQIVRGKTPLDRDATILTVCFQIAKLLVVTRLEHLINQTTDLFVSHFRTHATRLSLRDIDVPKMSLPMLSDCGSQTLPVISSRHRRKRT